MFLRLSLRVQLAVAGTFVLCVVLGSAAWMTAKALDRALTQEMTLKVRHSAPLLSAALVDPLLARDYATISQILNEVRKTDDFKYFVLLDSQQKVIASVGWAASRPLPQVDDLQSELPWDRADRCVHLMLDVVHGGQTLAQLRYGVSLDAFRGIRHSLVIDIARIALIAVLIGAGVLLLVGLGLTQGLNRLTRSIVRLARQHEHQALEETGSTELQLLARAFNRMAYALDERFRALEESRLRQAEYLQLASEEKAWLEALLSALNLGVLLVDRHGSIVYRNQAFGMLWGMHVGTDAPVDGGELVVEMSRALNPHSADEPLLMASLRPGRHARQELHLNSGLLLEENSYPVLSSDGVTIGHVWLYEDVTAERQASHAIQRLAQRDSLTGLFNRHAFFTALSDALVKQPDDWLAVLFIDLDNFKHINDLNGHAAGDGILTQVARALAGTFRPEDIIGRIGGDEFAVVVKNVTRTALDSMCDRLLKNIQVIETSSAEGERLSVACSIGVSWYPDDATDPHLLVAAADQAMYTAKAEGRATWRQYRHDTADLVRKSDYLVWTAKLSQAFELGLFRVCLQGVYRTDDLRLHHYEALIRLAESGGTSLFMPEEFIGHAELTGKIASIDRWMLTQCIQHLAQHPEHLPIAVNVSARTMVDTRMPDFVKAELDVHSVSAERLHLELTETSAVSQFELVEQVISHLQKLGCVLTIDDFGSGFSSVRYLTQLHANSVKIDGKFVLALHNSHEHQVLLRAIVEVAHTAGMLVVAEWVETAQTLDLVRSFGVDLVQGYFFDRPQPMTLL